jgi:CspA family cold shock protein
VKWFNATKGYGFIKPEGGGTDVFVHISAVEKAGYTNLVEGAKVSYELRSKLIASSKPLQATIYTPHWQIICRELAPGLRPGHEASA